MTLRFSMQKIPFFGIILSETYAIKNSDLYMGSQKQESYSKSKPYTAVF